MRIREIMETSGDFQSLKNMLKTGFQELGVDATPDPDMVEEFEKELNKIMPPSKTKNAAEEDIMKAQTRAARSVVRTFGLH